MAKKRRFSPGGRLRDDQRHGADHHAIDANPLDAFLMLDRFVARLGLAHVQDGSRLISMHFSTG